MRTSTDSRDEHARSLRRHLFAAVGIAGVLLGALPGALGTAAADVPSPPASAASAPAAASPATSAYTPVGPVRVLDTRLDGPALAPGATVVVHVRDTIGVADDAVAAAVTIAATEAPSAGFVTAWGDGPRPGTSALNLDAPGQTRANFAIVPIGADGTIRLYTHAGGHLVVDLAGVFRPTATAAAGRFVGIGPARLLDTRVARAPFAAGEERTVDLTPVGVPASADAAVISLTGIGPAGWFAAWEPGHAWPGTSVVNLSTPGRPATATAIVPIEGGRMQLSSLNGGDVVVDVTGYMTGAEAAADDDGLFVPVTPTRVHDTRDPASGGRPAGAGTTITRRMLEADGAGALAMSITAVEPATAGFVTIFPARMPRPNTASVNVDPNQTLATGTITPSSPAGTSVFTLASAHLVVDVTGWFLASAAAVPISTPIVPPAPPAPPGSYKLAMIDAEGTIARWDPCTSIEVVVDFTGAQPGAREALDAALAHAAVVSGLQFSVRETTSRARTNGLNTLTVLWLGGTELPAFRDGAVGVGGGSFGDGRILEGWVYIDRDDRMRSAASGASMLFDVLLHELGHALGLAHVDDDDQVMFPYVYERGSYQPGDLAGLELLGAAQGCLGSPGSSLRGPTGGSALMRAAVASTVRHTFEAA